MKRVQQSNLNWGISVWLDP